MVEGGPVLKAIQPHLDLSFPARPSQVCSGLMGQKELVRLGEGAMSMKGRERERGKERGREIEEGREREFLCSTDLADVHLHCNFSSSASFSPLLSCG